MIESLRTTQIAFFRFATPCGFFRGSGDEVQKVSVQGSVQEKIIWNHLWEHRFSVPDPRVLPPPDDGFFDTDDGKPNLWLGRTGSPVKISKCIPCWGQHLQFYYSVSDKGQNVRRLVFKPFYIGNCNRANSHYSHWFCILWAQVYN